MSGILALLFLRADRTHVLVRIAYGYYRDDDCKRYALWKLCITPQATLLEILGAPLLDSCLCSHRSPPNY